MPIVPVSDLNAVRSSGGCWDSNIGAITNAGSFGNPITASNNPRLIQLPVTFSF
jgi:hypothetical protein